MGIGSYEKERNFNYALIDELKTKINLKNYNNINDFEEDLRFVNEFLTNKYTIDEGKYKERDLRDKDDDIFRFIEIMKKNNINMREFI